MNSYIRLYQKTTTFIDGYRLLITKGDDQAWSAEAQKNHMDRNQYSDCYCHSFSRVFEIVQDRAPVS